MGKTIVYVRFPFKRGAFEDPGKIRFTERQEQELWTYLLECRLKDSTIDWELLSRRFDNIDISYLQQVSYWLYEKELLELKRGIEDTKKQHTQKEAVLFSRRVSASPRQAAALRDISPRTRVSPAKSFSFINPISRIKPSIATTTVQSNTVVRLNSIADVLESRSEATPRTYVEQTNELDMQSSLLYGSRFGNLRPTSPYSETRLMKEYASPSDSDDEILFDRSLLHANPLMGNLFPAQVSPKDLNLSRMDKRLREIHLAQQLPPKEEEEDDNGSEISTTSLSKSALELALIDGG
ncbi:hypothetical protein BABINDRAFT_9797 [Babjeviella inositovora NRRL Y-12698]|uniref:Autophagy-related protein 29 n=1 Tax=Babjeviella inositovora NRRL Y-12698 TaxID=984486 RepID=A0A1E3QJG0_9ASCO|nr:uncharacterized protein BABINDRAFT_9797 [Babjeviella inositovora NRRL Y-12698]ODQ77810.1 hypothetical protein BABINDRAFT_9797 [Babjeviella inositovora NRRL Y-12698]